MPLPLSGVVTQVGINVDLQLNPPKRITQVGINVDLQLQPPKRITQVGVTVDGVSQPGRITQVGVLVEAHVRRPVLNTNLLEFHVYDRYNNYLDYLDAAFDKSFLAQLSEVGAASFRIPADDDRATAENLAYGNIVHVRYRNTDVGAWVIEQVNKPLVSADEKAGRIAEVSGRGVLALLERGIIYPSDIDDQSTAQRAFGSVTAASIFLDLWAEFEARGGGDLTADFTDSLDSAGASWSDAQTVEFSAGQRMLEVARHLAGLGAIEFTAGEDLTLHAYACKGSDKSGTIIFREGLNILQCTRTMDGKDLANAVLGESQVAIIETTDADSIADHGRVEAYLPGRNTNDDGQVEAASSQLLDQVDEPVEAYALTVTTDTLRPFIDYDLGDTVRVVVPGEVDDDFRICSITLLEKQNPQHIEAALEVNRVLVNYLAKIHRSIEWMRAVPPTAAAGLNLASGDTRLLVYSGHKHTRDGVIGFTADGGGTVVSAGLKAYVPVPDDGVITSWEIVTKGAEGTVAIDVWAADWGDFPPVDGDSICGTAVPQLSGSAAQGTDLTGWTTSLSKGQWLGFNIDGIGTIEWLAMALHVEYKD